MSGKSKLLLDSNELITLQTQLAVVVGDRAAVALQQIHYWCDVTQRQAKRDHYHDDQWWVYNTWAEWQVNNFPFWTVSTLRRIFRDLETLGVVITRPHEDRNKGFWITVNYSALEALATAGGRTLKVRRLPKNKAGGSAQNEQTRSAQNEQTGMSKMNRPSAQNEQTTRETTETTRDSDSETTKKEIAPLENECVEAPSFLPTQMPSDPNERARLYDVAVAQVAEHMNGNGSKPKTDAEIAELNRRLFEKYGSKS